MNVKIKEKVINKTKLQPLQYATLNEGLKGSGETEHCIKIRT